MPGNREHVITRKIIRFICFSLILSLIPFPAAAEDFTNAIHAFLQQRVEVEKRDIGIVVGIVDEHGSRIVSSGKLDNGTDQEVNGDSLFDKPLSGGPKVIRQANPFFLMKPLVVNRSTSANGLPSGHVRSSQKCPADHPVHAETLAALASLASRNQQISVVP